MHDIQEGVYGWEEGLELLVCRPLLIMRGISVSPQVWMMSMN